LHISRQSNGFGRDRRAVGKSLRDRDGAGSGEVNAANSPFVNSYLPGEAQLILRVLISRFHVRTA